MLKYLTSLLLVCCLVLGTTAGSLHYSSVKKPYLAVFCNPGFEELWPGFNPDYLHVAFSWKEFDPFLKRVAREAKGRPIEIDIQTHGNIKKLHGNDMLNLSYDDIKNARTVSDLQTMGFIINHIESTLPRKDVTLILEICFSGNVYKNTIRGNLQGENCNHVPDFPVYGGTYNHMNLNNLAYIQYKTHVHRYLEDLRQYEVKNGPADVDADEESPDHKRMVSLYRILAPLYVP